METMDTDGRGKALDEGLASVPCRAPEIPPLRESRGYRVSPIRRGLGQQAAPKASVSSAWHTRAAPSPLIRRAMGLPAIILVVVLLVLDPFNSKEGRVGAQEGFQFETYVSKPIRPNQSNWAAGVVQVADGGFLVLAEVFDTTGQTGWPWLIETDAHGTVRWQREVGQDLRDAALRRGIPTSDNGAILVGSARAELNGGGPRERASGWIVRIGADGRIRWQRFVELANVTRLMDIQAMIDGGAIIAGRLRQNGLGPGGMSNRDSAVVMRLDGSGTTVWTRRYERPEGVWADLVLPRRSGGFVVGNTTNGPWLASLSDTGAVSWERRQERLGGVARLLGLAEAADGTLLVAAAQGLTGNESIYVLRLSSDGHLIWKRQIGQSRFCGVSGLWFARTTLVYAVGPTCSGVGKRLWAAALSGVTGTVLTEREFVSDKGVRPEYASATRSGGFAAVGSFFPPENGAWLGIAPF